MQPREVRIRVTPGSRTERIIPSQDPLYGDLQVYVAARAYDGKANQAVLRALAEHWNIPISHLRIKRGLASRDKVVLIYQA